MYDKKAHLKKIVVQRHRKNKNLCLRCGKELHDGDCVEDYTKADMRDSTIKKEQEEQIKRETIITPRKKTTIIHYREEKQLCVRCGKELHDGDCEEDYTKSDNRTDEEKQFRPAIITAPSRPTQEDARKNTQIDNDILSLEPNKKIKFYRDYIVINLSRSAINDYQIQLSAIIQLSTRLKDYILVLIGNVDNYFSYLDALKLQTLTNIHNVRFCTKQDMINYISGCRKYLSYYDDYIEYCKKKNIPYFEFDNTKNVTNMIPQEAYTL